MRQPPTSVSDNGSPLGGDATAGDLSGKDAKKETPATRGNRKKTTSKSTKSPGNSEASERSSTKPSRSTEAGETAELDATTLVQRHQRGVWRYLRMLGCDPGTADDLTQETFLRVFSRDKFVQHNDKATAGYLRRIAYNLMVSRHRKLGRVHPVSDSGVIDEVWDRWAGKDGTGDDGMDALRECLQALTERARKALKMRFADELSRVEIGDALGISDHGARNLMQRAKQQLRDCVEDKLRPKENTQVR